jgi:hypothetical protein
MDSLGVMENNISRVHQVYHTTLATRTHYRDSKPSCGPVALNDLFVNYFYRRLRTVKQEKEQKSP